MCAWRFFSEYARYDELLMLFATAFPVFFRYLLDFTHPPVYIHLRFVPKPLASAGTAD